MWMWIDPSLVDGGGKEGGFEPGGAAHGKLGAGHAVGGFDLLGVDGLISRGRLARSSWSWAGSSTRTTVKREAARPCLMAF
jgi:hypothetical protein